uniref:PLAC8 family protein n=1 Tax=Brugia timori TaxID=42155 RepID=A0A0R3QY46_9BILA
LNLISAEQPAIKQDDWFAKSADVKFCCLVRNSICQCCWDDRDASCHGVLSFLYCSKEECKNNWARRCLHHTARIVACYTVEFNYRTTTSYADVIQFLKENNYPNQEAITSIPIIQRIPPHPRGTVEVKDIAQSLAERCVAKMPQRLTHLRRYCTIFWNDKLCCSHCPGVC